MVADCPDCLRIVKQQQQHKKNVLKKSQIEISKADCEKKPLSFNSF